MKLSLCKGEAVWVNSFPSVQVFCGGIVRRLKCLKSYFVMPNSLKYSCSYNTWSSKSKELEHWKFIFNFITDRCSLLSLAPVHVFPCIFFNYTDRSWGDWFKGRACGYCGGSSALSAGLALELPRRHTFQCVYVSLQRGWTEEGTSTLIIGNTSPQGWGQTK